MTLTAADITATQPIPVITEQHEASTAERIDGITGELVAILATEDLPTPPPVAVETEFSRHTSADGERTPLDDDWTEEDGRNFEDLDAPPPLRTEDELKAVDYLGKLGGCLIALARELEVLDELPIAPLTGHVKAPKMLVEVTHGTDLERRAEVDRIARLLNVSAVADYLDVELHATYSASRRFGLVIYRVETVITPPPMATEAHDEQLVDAALAVPGALPPLTFDAMPAAGVPASPELVGADL
jgi:hypothetical protein